MSTRCTIRYITCGNVEIHIYKQMIDDKIYLNVTSDDTDIELLIPIMNANNPARSPTCPDGIWKDECTKTLSRLRDLLRDLRKAWPSHGPDDYMNLDLLERVRKELL